MCRLSANCSCCTHAIGIKQSSADRHRVRYEPDVPNRVVEIITVVQRVLGISAIRALSFRYQLPAFSIVALLYASLAEASIGGWGRSICAQSDILGVPAAAQPTYEPVHRSQGKLGKRDGTRCSGRRLLKEPAHECQGAICMG